MINLTCTYCGERMQFVNVSHHYSVNIPHLYKTKCVDAWCPTGYTYKELPQSIHIRQMSRFVDNLNHKSEEKAREKLI